MKFIAIKTEDGTIKGKLAFCCRMLHVSRQGFYKYLSAKDRPWKYQTLADAMLESKRQVFLRIFKSSDFPYNCN